MRTVLFIGKVWPEPASSAAGTRLMQLVDLFLRNNCQVHFGSAAVPTPYSQSLPVQVRAFPVALNDDSFDRELQGLGPDLVVFDRFTTEEQFGWRVAETCPAALRVLDTEDLHCLRAARQLALAEGKEPGDEHLRNDTAYREIASILRCDLSLIISSAEMTLLQDFYKIDESLLCYIPFLFERISADEVSAWPGFEERKHFVSIGNFLHGPNKDAARYLRNDIWPLVRAALPGAELHLFGAYADKEVESWHSPATGFIFKGRAEDSGKLMREARLCLAPLRAGAGLKGKLAEAMRYGTPSVTTAVGAEGMGPAAGWPGAVCETPADLAAAAIGLYSSGEAWARAQRRCFMRFNSIFNRPDHEKRLLERLAGLRAGLADHRAQNFTGAMLMHHSLNSKRWLSKYITAKNASLKTLSQIHADNEEKTAGQV